MKRTLCPRPPSNSSTTGTSVDLSSGDLVILERLVRQYETVLNREGPLDERDGMDVHRHTWNKIASLFNSAAFQKRTAVQLKSIFHNNFNKKRKVQSNNGSNIQEIFISNDYNIDANYGILNDNDPSVAPNSIHSVDDSDVDVKDELIPNTRLNDDLSGELTMNENSVLSNNGNIGTCTISANNSKLASILTNANLNNTNPASTNNTKELPTIPMNTTSDKYLQQLNENILKATLRNVLLEEQINRRKLENFKLESELIIQERRLAIEERKLAIEERKVAIQERKMGLIELE